MKCPPHRAGPIYVKIYRQNRMFGNNNRHHNYMPVGHRKLGLWLVASAVFGTSHVREAEIFFFVPAVKVIWAEDVQVLCLPINLSTSFRWYWIAEAWEYFARHLVLHSKQRPLYCSWLSTPQRLVRTRKHRAEELFELVVLVLGPSILFSSFGKIWHRHSSRRGLFFP